MYLGYFGLTERPFSIAPDPQYLYMSKRHKEAMAHLSYGLTQGGCFIVLTGEVGTGKTTLCRNLLGDLPDDIDVALILNANINEQELLQTICDELKIFYQSGDSQKQLLDKINQSLLATFAENRKTVLIIDEAQLLSRDVLEQIRLLTNLETTKSKLLQIILIGQPELSDLLARNDLRQLAQRITARYHLDALRRHEIEDYINFRLNVAGCKQPLFSRQAVTQMHALTDGIPRKINVLADHALLSAYANTQRMVDSKTVKQAGRDVFINTRPAEQSSTVGRFQLPRWWWAIPALLALNVGLWYSFTVYDWDKTNSDQLTVHRQIDQGVDDSLAPSGGDAPQRESQWNKTETPQATRELQKDLEANDLAELVAPQEIEEPQSSQEQSLPAVIWGSEQAGVVVNTDADIVPGSVLVSEEFLDASPIEQVPSEFADSPQVATNLATSDVGNLSSSNPELSGAPFADELDSEVSSNIPQFNEPANADSITIPDDSEELGGSQTLGASESAEANEYRTDTPFGKVLETSADLTGRIEVFRALANQWQATLPRKLLKPACDALLEQGLRCLGFDSWSWFQRLNRPGIMVLKHRDELHRVLVQSIVDDNARVLIDQQYYEVPIAELLARWINSGVVFWRPSEIGGPYLEQGSKGPIVPKVRLRLNRVLAAVDLPLLNNTTDPEFDLDMAQKVFALQSRFGIYEDSRIGNETHLLMNEILSPQDTIVLSTKRGPNRTDPERFGSGPIIKPNSAGNSGSSLNNLGSGSNNPGSGSNNPGSGSNNPGSGSNNSDSGNPGGVQ